MLHVIGENFDPQPLLAALSLPSYSVFRRGDKRFPENSRSEKIRAHGGFKCDVSSAAGVLAEEAKDATEFLERHYDSLMRLKSVPLIEDISISAMTVVSMAKNVVFNVIVFPQNC